MTWRPNRGGRPLGLAAITAIAAIAGIAAGLAAIGAAAPSAGSTGAVRDADRRPAGPRLAADADAAIELTWGVKIPLRDGVLLNATLYRPRPAAGRLPTLFRLNPYRPDAFHRDAKELARHGYAFAAVDARGRGNSGGSFEPWRHDGKDGADVVEWLARQPWSNGRVGMLGESQLGRAVWSTLKEHPPHLAAAAPIAAGYPLLSWRNMVTPDLVQTVAQTAGVTANDNIAFDDAFWIARFRELYLRHLPLRQLDRLAGFPSPTFQRILDHPDHDAFWSAVLPQAADYRRIEVPLLTITGLYDSNQGGALLYYREQQRAATPAGRDRHDLVIGPWDHAGTTHPRAEVGGLRFGPASTIDLTDLLRRWFDDAMGGAPRPAFLKKRVAYYVAGAEEWRYADRLEEATGTTRSLYLSGAGGAGRPGRLDTAPPSGAGARADRWVYDPLDTRPEALDRAPVDGWATSQRYVQNLFGAGVAYRGEPLGAPLEIAGTPRLSLWIAMDVPDADLTASIDLVLPDGGSILLGEDSLRARYRRSAERQELVRPGAIERYDFTFPFHARRAPRGSRLRLVVRSPNDIYREKNYGSGGAVADESGADARTAHLTLFHDAAHPSALELPLARAAEPAAGRLAAAHSSRP